LNNKQESVVKEKKHQADLQSANDAAQARADFVIQQAAARKASLEQTIEGTYGLQFRNIRILGHEYLP
jgi:hypothetical protein